VYIIKYIERKITYTYLEIYLGWRAIVYTFFGRTIIQRDGSVQCPYIKANARTSIKKIVKYSRRNRTINVAADCRKANSLHYATAQNSHKNYTTRKGKFIIPVTPSPQEKKSNFLTVQGTSPRVSERPISIYTNSLA